MDKLNSFIQQAFKHLYFGLDPRDMKSPALRLREQCLERQHQSVQCLGKDYYITYKNKIMTLYLL